MSRRGNGLSADAYTPLIDLAPELADTMLTALREAGIAAYAAVEAEARPEDAAGPAQEPAPDPEWPAPEPPLAAEPGARLERLYVDDAMESAAEDILHTHLSRLREQRRGAGSATETESTSPSQAADTDTDPGHTPGSGGSGTGSGGSGSGGSGADGSAGGPGAATAERDEEAIWAEIVAGFDEEPEDGPARWPDQENVRPDEPDVQDAAGRLPTSRVIKPAGSDIAAPHGLDAADEDTDDEGHYVPPPPPPLPTGDPVTRGAWLALVGGPLYLLLTVILGWEVPGWAAFLAVAAFIGGFVALVLRMGDEPRDDDDGAVI